jgi:S-formylglutathione hydrolase FrmB
MHLSRFLSITLGLAVLMYFAFTLSSCHRVEPGADFALQADGVSMQDVDFPSKSLGRETRYRVYLPRVLPVGQKLPVVYLLHGNDGGFRDWSNHTGVAQYAAPGVILVMPEGGSSYYMKAVGKPQDKYEDYVTRDLIGDVESRFPAQSGRSNRALVGVSMGGFAAVTLALRHPDMFVFAGAISPAIDVPERRFTWKRAGQWWKFRSIFGPWASAERSARDPFLLLRAAKPESTPFFYLTAGEQEPLREPIERFAGRLQAGGFAYEFHTKARRP